MLDESSAREHSLWNLKGENGTRTFECNITKCFAFIYFCGLFVEEVVCFVLLFMENICYDIRASEILDGSVSHA